MSDSDFTTSQLPTGSDEQVTNFMKWAIAADVMDWGWCPDDDTSIQYAQNDEATLHAFIDNIRMHDGTGTFYAMKYAVAMLDPATQPAFANLESLGQLPAKFKNRPAAWNEPEWAKIIVLMTDGQITDQFRPTKKLDPINETTELQYRPGGDGYKSSSRSTNLSRFYSQCDLAKSNGIVIFTIAYDAPAGAQTEMRNCASSPSHFFKASVAELADTFETIASSITKLRLTQ